MSCLSLTTKTAESNQRQQAAIGYLSVLFASVLFGSVFTLAKIPLERVDPLALAALTYTIAGLSLIHLQRCRSNLAPDETTTTFLR